MSREVLNHWFLRLIDLQPVFLGQRVAKGCLVVEDGPVLLSEFPTQALCARRARVSFTVCELSDRMMICMSPLIVLMSNSFRSVVMTVTSHSTRSS